MSRAIIHIGAGKTGSTAIQYFLTHNAGALRRLGFSYPIVAEASTRADGANHNRLAYRLLEPRQTATERTMARALARSARESPVTLLSAEVLYMRPFETECISPQAYLEAKNAAIDRLFDLLAPFDQVDVLCYVRRHDRWIESIYNERIKTGRERGTTFAEFAGRFGRSHYRPQLEAWAKRAPVSVRPYETAALGESGLTGDFCSAVGIKERLPDPPKSVRSSNPALGRDFVEFARLAARLPLGRRQRARLATGLVAISAFELAERPEPKSWGQFFSFEQRNAYLERFAGDDSEVARRFLSSGFDRLFAAPLPSETADYPGLDTERSFEIAGKLIEYDRALSSPLMRRLRKYSRLILPGTRRQ
jgi:hypothetical protein